MPIITAKTPIKLTKNKISGMGLVDYGYCTECGDEHDNVEPDAERYKCANCGAYAVFGAQQLLLMGLVEIEE